MDAFTGRTAVITGAAGAIGSAIAARLIASGAMTILLDRTRDAIEEVVAHSRWNPASVRCCEVDLASETGLGQFAQDLRDTCPQVDILVHAAGAIVPATISDGRLADFDSQYVVNVRAPFQLTQALLPVMVTCGGQIVFLNSSAGLNARAGVSQYAATKHALRALADALRDEVNPRGVRVMSVFLGRTASGMQAAVHAWEGHQYHPERLLQPDDVASIVVHALGLPRTAEVTDLHIRPMLKR